MKFEMTAKQKKIIQWLPCLVLVAVLGFSVITGGVYCDAMTTAFTSVMDILYKIMRIVGAFIVVFAIFQMVMAFKNEDSDSKSRAATFLAVGVALFMLPVALKKMKIESWLND